MAGVRKRKMEADYINVAADGSAQPIYALMGTGFSALTETPGAATSSKRYINMDSSSQRVTGYEWTAPFEADQIPDEAAIAYIVNIARKQLTGVDAETDYIQVDLDEPVDSSENTFAARMRKVAIAVSDMPNNDGDLGVNGTLHGVTDPIEGTFDVSSKTFTPNA